MSGVSLARVLIGDCREQMRTLDAGSVRCCVTSPPYWGLRDYGVDGQLGLEETPEAFVAGMVDVFREVRRVLADDGTLWLNIGDSYAANGQRSNNNGTGASTMGWPGQNKETLNKAAGLALPSLKHGLKPKDLVGIPWRVAFALQADGWWLRSEIIWHKPNPMPESVTDRPTKSHEQVFLLTKAERYFYDCDAVREPYTGEPYEGSDNGAILNGDRADKGKTCGMSNPLGRNARSVWSIPSQPYAGAHFATFPEELPRRCILAGSAMGDTILDPFTGSGTTGAVALKEGRRFVGCELNPKYAALAERRLCVTPNLFMVAT